MAELLLVVGGGLLVVGLAGACDPDASGRDRATVATFMLVGGGLLALGLTVAGAGG